MNEADARIERKEVKSADGTRIVYYTAGSGEKTCVFAPGLGTPMNSWAKVTECFHDRYKIVTWECRGSYDSEIPKDPTRLGVKDHVEDLIAICQAEGLESFALGGWSMGVQISLEFYHQFPERVRALLLINGAFEHILDTAMSPLPFPGQILPVLSKTAMALHPIANPLIRLLLGSWFSPYVLRGMTMIGKYEPFFLDTLDAFAEHQWNNYFNMMQQLHEHSAAPYLGEVKVPTLITAGTKDRLTPHQVMVEMNERINGSQLFSIPGGTHFSMFEYPEAMNLRLEKFLRELDPELFV
jgi:pimeloyl-ACP methyl ester carboxylesterase